MRYFINPQEKIVETRTGGVNNHPDPGYVEVTRFEYETMYLVWTIGFDEISRIAWKFGDGYAPGDPVPFAAEDDSMSVHFINGEVEYVEPGAEVAETEEMDF